MDVEDDLPQYDCAEVVPVPKALQGQNPECFHDLKAEDMCELVVLLFQIRTTLIYTAIRKEYTFLR
jgi:hypothetical protein